MPNPDKRLIILYTQQKKKRRRISCTLIYSTVISIYRKKYCAEYAVHSIQHLSYTVPRSAIFVFICMELFRASHLDTDIRQQQHNIPCRKPPTHTHTTKFFLFCGRLSIVNQGGVIFEEKTGLRQVGPNFFRTPSPKYHLVMLH